MAAGVAVFGVVGEEEETLNRLAIMARFETRVPEFPEVDGNSQKSVPLYKYCVKSLHRRLLRSHYMEDF